MIAGIEKLRLKGNIIVTYKAGNDLWYIKPETAKRYDWKTVVSDEFVDQMEVLYGCKFLKVTYAYHVDDMMAEAMKYCENRQTK